MLSFFAFLCNSDQQISDTNFHYLIISSKALMVGTNSSTENCNAPINKSIENVIIPKYVQGYTTTAIGTWAFRNGNNIKTITIPSTIIEIFTDAFAHLESLVSFKIQKKSSLARIHRGFLYNTKVTDIELPPTVSTIGVYSFGKGIFQSLTYCGKYQFTEKTLFEATEGFDGDPYKPPDHIFISSNYLFDSFGKATNLEISSFCHTNFPSEKKIYIPFQVFLFLVLLY